MTDQSGTFVLAAGAIACCAAAPLLIGLAGGTGARAAVARLTSTR